MKKTVKKIIMGLVTSSIAVSCGGFSVAAQESADFLSGDFYYDYLFRETGVTPFKLHNLEDELGVDVYEYFGIDLPTKSDYEEYLLYSDSEEYHNSGENGISPQSGVGIDENYQMEIKQWNALLALAREGASDILITKDCSTVGAKHGHTALVYGGGKNVEHLGPTNSKIPGSTGKSRYISMSVFWSHCKTCRLYEVPEARENGLEIDIAEYARNNLVDWNYSPLADVNSSSVINCATLVWRAYNENGITLNHTDNTCVPGDFVTNNKFDMIFTIGWGSTNPYVW